MPNVVTDAISAAVEFARGLLKRRELPDSTKIQTAIHDLERQRPTVTEKIELARQAVERALIEGAPTDAATRKAREILGTAESELQQIDLFLGRLRTRLDEARATEEKAKFDVEIAAAHEQQVEGEAIIRDLAEITADVVQKLERLEAIEAEIARVRAKAVEVRRRDECPVGPNNNLRPSNQPLTDLIVLPQVLELNGPFWKGEMFRKPPAPLARARLPRGDVRPATPMDVYLRDARNQRTDEATSRRVLSPGVNAEG